MDAKPTIRSAAEIWREAYVAVYGCEITHRDAAYEAGHRVIDTAIQEAREAERAAVFKQVREALEAQRGEWSRAKTFDLLDAIEAGSHLSQESGRG